MQVSITLSEIQNLATNGKVFARGKAIAQGDAILALYYLEEVHVLLAKVQSSQSDTVYLVQIHLSQRDRPKRISCSCPAARQYLGCCKHMVAVLLRSMDERLEKMPRWQGQLPALPVDFAENRKTYTEAEEKTPDRVAPRTPAAELRSESLPARSATIEQNTAVATKMDAKTAADLAAPLRLMQLRSLMSRNEIAEDTHTEARESLHFELLLQLPKLTAETALLSAHIRIEQGAQQRTYKVKQLEAFLENLAAGKSYYFGQALNFDPQIHAFDSVGERFLNWLLQIRDRAVERQPYEYLSKNTHFNGPALLLNPQRLWDFMQHFATDSAALGLKISRGPAEKAVPAVIKRAFPPLHFYWAENKSEAGQLLSLTLRKNNNEVVQVYSPQALKDKEEAADLRLLTRDAALLLYQEQIYCLPGQDLHSATLRLLLQQLALSENRRLDFSARYAAAFLTQVYPLLHANGNLRLSPTQDEAVVNTALQPSVWLDRDGRAIRLQLGFSYGKYLLNAHPASDEHCVVVDSELAQKGSESLLETAPAVVPPVIIRDTRRETALYRLLEQYKFLAQPIRKMGKSKASRLSLSPALPEPERGAHAAYYLFGESQIVNFLGDGIDTLREQGVTLYLSRQFKQMMLRPLAPFKARLRIDESSQLLHFDVDDWPYTQDEMQRILSAYREKRSYARLKDGSFVQWQLSEEQATETEAYVDANSDALDSDAHELQSDSHKLALLNSFELWGAKTEEGQISLPAYRAVHFAHMLYGAANDQAYADLLDTTTADARLSQMLRAIEEPSSLQFDVPAELQAILRRYQVSGFHWLCSLDYYGFGGILADDMGLGKTLQALSYIRYKKDQQPQPVLVAAPTSLIYNWQAEAKKFLPDLKVLLLEGTKKARLSQIERINDYELIVCSYAVLRQDSKDLRAFEFSAFFIDEAQFIKNPNTQTARAVKKISASRRFALTGTPIENSLSELWSIFDFLMPGYLFSQRRFQERLETPIVREQDQTALHELRLLTKPFILRRLKKEVLKELPDKIETELLCDMSAAQDKLYFAYLSGARDELNRMQGEAEFRRSQMQVLSLLTRLRQLACHPALFLSDYDGGSGKLDALDELIDNLMESGHKSLIFSQFTSLLQLVRQRLEARGINSYYLDGSVSAKERLALSDAFNSDQTPLFLISLRAGGTGLNLTGADTVIHLDPWWNPAVEDQATDRAHRIGQRKVVQIFRLIARGSIEEKIALLKEDKRRLISEIIQSGEDGLQKLSLEELRGLLSS